MAKVYTLCDFKIVDVAFFGATSAGVALFLMDVAMFFLFLLREGVLAEKTPTHGRKLKMSSSIYGIIQLASLAALSSANRRWFLR